MSVYRYKRIEICVGKYICINLLELIDKHRLREYLITTWYNRVYKGMISGEGMDRIVNRISQ